MRNAPVVGNNTNVTKRKCSRKEVEIIMLQKRGITNAMALPLLIGCRDLHTLQLSAFRYRTGLCRSSERALLTSYVDVTSQVQRAERAKLEDETGERRGNRKLVPSLYNIMIIQHVCAAAR